MQDGKQRRIFDTWIDQHKGLLFKVVRAYASTPEDRDDLFQEIALQVWDSIPRYRSDSAVTTWLYRVALYAAISWTRKEKRHHTGRQSLGEVDHTLTAASEIEDSRLKWLYAKIAELPEKRQGGVGEAGKRWVLVDRTGHCSWGTSTFAWGCSKQRTRLRAGNINCLPSLLLQRSSFRKRL